MIESNFHFEVFGIFERTKNDVEQREVRVIGAMNAACMMIAVAFGSLNDIAQPLGCFDIGVLEDAEEICAQYHDRGGLRRKARHEAEAYTAQDSPAHHVERAKIKGAIGIEPFGAVMHLVEGLPQKVGAVQGIVPNKNAELIEEHPHDSAHHSAQAG